MLLLSVAQDLSHAPCLEFYKDVLDLPLALWQLRRTQCCETRRAADRCLSVLVAAAVQDLGQIMRSTVISQWSVGWV